MTLLQQFQLSASPHSPPLLAFANFADFGATDHMTSIKSLLFDIITLPIPYLVSLPNGHKVKVTNVGSLALFPDLILHNILYIPSFKHNLISVQKLLNHCDDVVQFTESACTFQGPSVKKPLVLGRLDTGLYKLFQHVTSPIDSAHVNSCSSVVSSLHVSSLPVVSNATAANDNSSINTMAASNKLIHIDTWGPYSTPTHSGAKCFLTIVYDYTRATWTHLMGAKSNAFDLLKAFISMVGTQFQTRVQTVRSDNALKLGSSSSSDVIFHEHIFPFLKHSPSPSPVLPSLLIPGHFSDDSSSSIPTSIPGPSSPLVLLEHISHDSTSSLSPSVTIPSPSPFTPDLSSDASPSSLSSPVPASSAPSSDPPPLRRSSRPHTVPAYLQDFAAAIPEWQEAMRKEFEALEANRTWDIVELPPGELDLNNAFLHGDLDGKVFMKVPPGLSVSPSFSSSPPLVCKLLKSLYGLRQVSRQWYAKLSQALCSRGYSHSLNDYSLFTRGSGSSLVILAVYVDDVILTGTDLSEISSLKGFLHYQFRIKDLSYLNYFLRIEVLYCDSSVLLHQKKFIHDLLESFASSASSIVVCPLTLNEKLKASVGDPLPKPEEYRCLVGKLNFLTHTRPDISFAVQHLSQFLQAPRVPHMQAASHLLRYFKGTSDFGLFFSHSPNFALRAYCDSDWASCADSRRSVTGFCAFLGDCLVSWKSKKQPVVSLSSAEAEYRAMSKAAVEVTCLSRLLYDFGIPSSSSPVSLYCDNQVALHIARNPVFHERTKHIELDCHFVRSKIGDGLISLAHVSSYAQVADILTKALLGPAHHYHLCKLRVLSPSNLMGTVRILDKG
ncbi:PREDICTED: uncharacterized protein LOC109206491 [Nicotiana attenuata]|uniref:uncharacterized protein LOC109206491 n=1 Tax=Nicotiana attenuata TaxID=49451 RepID=UPI000904CE59|nr:PREDICTED: uncharacterized protein LOC109206491 [Nicotiana attenuata]